MKNNGAKPIPPAARLPKCPTGIQGLDEITGGALRRLFRWRENTGGTPCISAESGREHLTRDGLEEYVSDCVVVLDHRINEQIATRHLRVVKYRGSPHGTNEYPCLGGDDGIS